MDRKGTIDIEVPRWLARILNFFGKEVFCVMECRICGAEFLPDRADQHMAVVHGLYPKC